METAEHSNQIAFTETQLLAYNVATRCAASLSLCASIYMAVSAIRCRSRIYHRLILGLSTHLILYCCWHLYGSAAVPEGSPNSRGARGTTQTCTAQGFFLQLSFCVPLYYVCLSFYSFFAVRNNFDVVKYLWIEKWIHVGVHVFPVGSALYLLSIEAFNFSGNKSACWIDSIPYGCGDGTEVECTRGPQNITQVASIFAALPALFVLICPTCVMAALYCQVRRRQDRIRLQSMEVAKQASLYLCALYWSYVFAIINNSFRWIADKNIFWLDIMGVVNLNLLGVYVLLIYLRFRKRSLNSGTPPAQSSLEGLTSIRSEVATDNAASEFNIFDGSNPTGEFAEFIFEGDAEDNEADMAESAKWKTIQDHI